MPKRVVSNTTPILSLLKIGHLDLLQQLYGEINIPQAVWQEIEAGKNKAYYVDLTSVKWINILSIQTNSVLDYITGLDLGEAETIVLARELGADLVVLDERLGRRYAEYYGLTVTGTLGILLKAKHKGLIAAIAPLIEKLQTEGVWLDKSLIKLVLAKSGETDN